MVSQPAVGSTSHQFLLDDQKCLSLQTTQQFQRTTSVFRIAFSPEYSQKAHTRHSSMENSLQRRGFLGSSASSIFQNQIDLPPLSSSDFQVYQAVMDPRFQIRQVKLQRADLGAYRPQSTDTLSEKTSLQFLASEDPQADQSFFIHQFTGILKDLFATLGIENFVGQYSLVSQFSHKLFRGTVPSRDLLVTQENLDRGSTS